MCIMYTITHIEVVVRRVRTFVYIHVCRSVGIAIYGKVWGHMHRVTFQGRIDLAVSSHANTLLK